MEDWKDIPGWEGIYQVSNLGRVKRIQSGPGATAGRIKIGYKTGGGYLQVDLSSPGRKTICPVVHRLVLSAFVGLCPEGKEANHKNGIRTDNRLDNLEWVTRSENLIHSIRVLNINIARGINFPQAKLNDDKVRKIKELFRGGMTYAQLSKIFDVSMGAIAHVIKGRSWRHIGGEQCQ